MNVGGLAHGTGLRNMMNYHLDCFRLVSEDIHQMTLVAVVGFAHVTVLRDMMNYHFDCFRSAEGIHRMSQVDGV